jgi:hypothetical protein
MLGRNLSCERPLTARLIQICSIIVLLPSTACGPLRLPTEEQYLIYSKQSLPVDSLDERQDSTYNDNAFT